MPSIPAKPPGYRNALAELFRDKKTLLAIILLGFLTGLAVQVNWIQTKCSNEPFIGSQLAVCKDNVARVVLGGPVTALAVLLFTAWLKKVVPGLPHRRAVLLFVTTLPLGALPLIKNEAGKNLLIATTIGISLIYLIYLLRAYLWAGIQATFAKPSFSVKADQSRNRTRITISGQLVPGEKQWIFDSMLDILMNTQPKGKEIDIDISTLTDYDSTYAHIFHSLAAWAVYHRATLHIIGSEQRKRIETSMIFRFHESANSLK